MELAAQEIYSTVQAPCVVQSGGGVAVQMVTAGLTARQALVGVTARLGLILPCLQARYVSAGAGFSCGVPAMFA